MAAARVLNIVKGGTLGVDDEARDGRGKHFGKKLEMVIDLIKYAVMIHVRRFTLTCSLALQEYDPEERACPYLCPVPGPHG